MYNSNTEKAVNPAVTGIKKAVNPAVTGIKKAVNPTVVGTEKGRGEIEFSPHFISEKERLMEELKIYTLSKRYYNYIKHFDSKVPRSSGSKEKRPFVGVVLEINGCNYFAPLTSPKPKHLRMRNMEDFHKIEGGKLGAINFNNMIPIPMKEVSKADLDIKITDTESTKKYKRLLENQRRWCNDHRTQIRDKAANLHEVVNKPEKAHLKERCCNFELLEDKCIEYERSMYIRREKDFEEEL